MAAKLRGVPVVYFEENNVIIAHCVPLDVSSCGRDLEEAQRNIHDAIAGFVRACEKMGTLEEVLEESGFTRDGDLWVPPSLLGTAEVDMLVAVGIGRERYFELLAQI